MADESERFLGVFYDAFELGVLGGFEHGLEAGAGAVSSGDEFASGEEEFGLDGLGRGGLVLLAGEVVEGEVAVG